MSKGSLGRLLEICRRSKKAVFLKAGVNLSKSASHVILKTSD